MRKESEVHVFYDIHRVTDDGALMMVSVNGAILSRDRITPESIVMVTANARGNYKLVWHTFLEGREALPDPAFCSANGIDIENPGPQNTKADGSRLAKMDNLLTADGACAQELSCASAASGHSHTLGA